MKGEIRTYRGYNQEHGWVYGFLVINEDGWFIVNTDVIWLQENGFPGLEKRLRVNSMSVCQKIGFDAQNGKPLFEFDIVDVVLPQVPFGEQRVVRGVIEYDEEVASYRVKSYRNFKEFEEDMVYDSQPLHDDVKCYLLGNAYEHPELIKLNKEI